MSRYLPVALLVALSAAVVALGFVRCVDCPDCDAHPDCLRCDGRDRITVWEARRSPLADGLLKLLTGQGSAALHVADLAEAQGRPRREVLGWKEREEYFCFAEAVQVSGPDGPLVLAVLTAKTVRKAEGRAHRIMLLDRGGRELDRFDAVIPESFSLESELVRDRVAPRVRLFGRISESPAGPLVLTSAAGEEAIPRSRWPSDWQTEGLADIAPKDGRLQVVPR